MIRNPKNTRLPRKRQIQCPIVHHASKPLPCSSNNHQQLLLPQFQSVQQISNRKSKGTSDEAKRTPEIRRIRIPGNPSIDWAAFAGRARRHSADALFRRATSLLLRFLQTSVEQELIGLRRRRPRLRALPAAGLLRLGGVLRRGGSHDHRARSSTRLERENRK